MARRDQPPGGTAANENEPSGAAVTVRLRGCAKGSSRNSSTFTPPAPPEPAELMTKPLMVPSGVCTITTSRTSPSVVRVTVAEPPRPVWSSVAVRRCVPSGTSARTKRPAASVGETARPARFTLANGMGVTPSVPTKTPRTVAVPPRRTVALPPASLTVRVVRPATRVPPIVRAAETA